MEVFIKVSQFLLSLSILIVLHELGHFIPAKIFKTKVEKFYLFFDYKFSLFKKKIGDTVYGIGWIPLGGYVKIAGMIDESMDTAQLAEEPKPYEFRSKPAWQRLIIMLGGVTVNFILGILIYIFILNVWGEQYIPNKSVEDGIYVQDSLGLKMGLQTGDKILEINDEPMDRFDKILSKFINGDNYTIERNGEIIKKDIPIDFIGQLVDRKRNKGSFIMYRFPFVVGAFGDSSLNKDSGLLPKDMLIEVNNKPIKYYDEFEDRLKPFANQTIPVKVKRKDEEISLNIRLDENAKMGVYASNVLAKDMNRLGFFELKNQTYSFAQAVPGGFKMAYEKLMDYIGQIKKVLNPKTGAYRGLGGFISIGSIFPSTWDWQTFLNITAFLSIMLGFMNLLPIPALDGGHVVFTLYEMISGRKPSDKFLEYAQIAGFILLIALLLYANGNDVYKWLTDKF